MPEGRQAVDRGSGIAVTMRRTTEERAGKTSKGSKTTVAEHASQNLRQGSSATKAPHSTELSPSRQLSRGAGHSFKESRVELGHPAHVRVVGKLHLVLQLLCNDVGREGRHAATLALDPSSSPQPPSKRMVPRSSIGSFARSKRQSWHA